MILRDVERFEVAPTGLDLGAFGDLVAHADEDVLERLTNLGDQMQVAGKTTRQHLGQIQAVGRETCDPRGGDELSAAAFGQRLEPAAQLVQEPADRRRSSGASDPKLTGTSRRSVISSTGNATLAFFDARSKAPSSAAVASASSSAISSAGSVVTAPPAGASCLDAMATC